MITDTSTLTTDSHIPEFDWRFVLGREKIRHWDHFDPRITSIYLYRSTNPDGPYHFLYDISTLRDDPNLTHGPYGHIGGAVHIEGGNYEPGEDVTDWELVHYVNRYPNGAHDVEGRTWKAVYDVSGVSGDVLYLSKQINHWSTVDADMKKDNIWRDQVDCTLGTLLEPHDWAATTPEGDLFRFYRERQDGSTDPSTHNNLLMGTYIRKGSNLIEHGVAETIGTGTYNWVTYDLESDQIRWQGDSNMQAATDYPKGEYYTPVSDNVAGTIVDYSIEIDQMHGGLSDYFGASYRLADQVITGDGSNNNVDTALKENTNYVLSCWVEAAFECLNMMISVGSTRFNSTSIPTDTAFTDSDWVSKTTPLADKAVLIHTKNGYANVSGAAPDTVTFWGKPYGSDDGTSRNSNVQGTHFQVLFNTGPKSGWADNGGIKELYVNLLVGHYDNFTDGKAFYINDLSLYETVSESGHRFSGGPRVLVDPSWTLPPNDALINNAMLISPVNAGSGPYIPNKKGDATEAYIIGNTDRAVYFDIPSGNEPAGMASASPWTVPTDHHYNAFISPNYLQQRWIQNQEHADNYPLEIELKCFDKMMSTGAEHPTGLTSSNIEYKYSTMIAGRNFVGNVVLNPTKAKKQPWSYTGIDSSGKTGLRYIDKNINEVHTNWILYSELNQPDIIPIINYISLQDLQGGAITGMARLMGDLIVFMDRGIYRLNIPSTDPTAWSLIESEENIGCQAEHSVTPMSDGVFFASQDDVYFLDNNFVAHSITTPIRDEYQNIVRKETVTGTVDGAHTHMEYDPNKKRILCRFGLETQFIYAYYIHRQFWQKMDMGGDTVYNFYPDENLVVYTINHNTQAQEDTQLHTMTPETSTETNYMTYKTGIIQISPTDSKNMIRRLDMRFKSDDDITVRFYIDGSSTASKSMTISRSETEQMKSFRVGLRAKTFQLELTTATSANRVEIGRLEVQIDE